MVDGGKADAAKQDLPHFPGQHPARHAASQWMEKLNDHVAHHKLQTAMRGEAWSSVSFLPAPPFAFDSLQGLSLKVP